jgi:PiT family inorganic phosphate transporter
MVHLSGSIILGWALGSNDAANVFGTAVASRMIRYRTAVVLAAVFIIVGAVLEGGAGLRTLGGLSEQTPRSALIVSLAAAGTVLLMTALRLPVSASQAVVGAILGAGLRLAPATVQWSGLGKVVACWLGTPAGAALAAAGLYPLLGAIFDRLPMNLVTRSIVLKSGLLIGGCYGAYALGANNVANVTGMFLRTGLFEGYEYAELRLSLTFSRSVMFTVGSRLVQLGAFSALVAVLAGAVTVHVYAVIGVPVSTSQAIVGAVLGIGLVKSVRTIHRATLGRIFLGWVATPAVAGAAAYAAAWA